MPDGTHQSAGAAQERQEEGEQLRLAGDGEASATCSYSTPLAHLTPRERRRHDRALAHLTSAPTMVCVYGHICEDSGRVRSEVGDNQLTATRVGRAPLYRARAASLLCSVRFACATSAVSVSPGGRCQSKANGVWGSLTKGASRFCANIHMEGGWSGYYSG